MSTHYQAPALSLSQRHIVAVLLRLRRFVNRSVANRLANCERGATQFMRERLGEREKAGPSLHRISVRAVLFGLIIVGALSPAVATFVHDHHGDGAVQERSDKRKPVDCPGGPCNSKKACTKRTFV